MRIHPKFLLSPIVGAVMACTLQANACTHFMLKAQDGTVMVTRTLEFGPNLNSQVVTSPRGTQFTSPAPDGGKGLSWTSKYGYVYLNFFGQDQATDGMNEQGLSIGYLYLPAITQYPTVPKGKEREALSYLNVGDWILGNFSSVDEVKDAIKKQAIFANKRDFGSYKNVIFPLHLVITDKTGKSITVEFTHGKINVYDNKNGVLTNTPSYPWQVTNQYNYANLSPNTPNFNTYKVDGVSYSGTGQGSGAVGLPGDYSPPSRFTKMSFLTKYAAPTKNAAELLNMSQHIINTVDIPKGIVRGVKGDNTPDDITQWTVFKDLNHHKLYFHSFENSTLKEVDLDKLNLTKGAPVYRYPVTSPQITINVTDKLTQ